MLELAVFWVLQYVVFKSLNSYFGTFCVKYERNRRIKLLSCFFKIIYKTGGMLTRVEASETPTRSYIVNMAEQERNSILNKKADEKIISEVMDAVLDDIVKQ